MMEQPLPPTGSVAERKKAMKGLQQEISGRRRSDNHVHLQLTGQNQPRDTPEASECSHTKSGEQRA